jgi:capsular polysaccharide transport system permease protein
MKLEGSNLRRPSPASRALSVWRAGTKPLLVRKNIFRGAVAISLCAAAYWGFIASDRYVSQADVIIQHTAAGGNQPMDLGALLAGGASSGNRPDQLLLRNFLLSTGMLNKLEAALHLRAHYSDPARDPWSRMWSPSVSQEAFHRYYLSHVSVEFDDYAGVLVIKAQGFDPKTAQAITTLMVAEGEKYMNDIGHRLAQAQVSFLETQVAKMAARFEEARLAVLAYQSKKGMVSPLSNAESGVGNINKLQATRVELQTRRTALLAYLAPKAPGVVDLDAQIDAIEQQISQEKSALTAPNNDPLNRTVEQFQRLEMAAVFAEDIYKTALTGLEKGRMEATRTLQKISVLQAPTLPEEALEPRRLYNIITFVLVTMLIAGILNLLAAIIRDHKD